MPRELTPHDILNIELRLGYGDKVELTRDEAEELLRVYEAEMRGRDCLADVCSCPDCVNHANN